MTPTHQSQTSATVITNNTKRHTVTHNKYNRSER